METTVSGPAFLSFYWKVSSEANYDFLRFYVDGVQQASISGEAGWTPFYFSVPSGYHTLKWEYTKDVSVNTGSDAGWVDWVQLGAATPTISPNGGTYTGSVAVTLSTATSGASIYFTTDGTEPSMSSTLYSSPFVLTASCRVQAKTYAAALDPSPTADAGFLVTPGDADGDGLPDPWDPYPSVPDTAPPGFQITAPMNGQSIP